MTGAPLSLRRRLVLQLLGIAAALAILLYLTVRTVANSAAEATQDGVLGAATLAIAERLQGSETGVSLDLPYEAFSILGSISDDRIFYRVDANGETLTGYPDLPMPADEAAAVEPAFYSTTYRAAAVRVAATSRTVLVNRKPILVTVAVAQTRQGQEAIAQRTANLAAAIGLAVFAFAALLSMLTAGSVLRPINRLAEAVGRRGPHDLRAVDHPAPIELRPLIASLNGFIARLRGALSRTETFIAEAAHHIRTPLATVRTRAEIALRQSETDAAREALRAVIRAVEESSRSASQLLDHATVVYRSDRLADGPVDLAKLLHGLVRFHGPTAELRDLALELTGAECPVLVQGDRLLLESALRNLIDNAIKYSPPEGVIELGLDLRGDNVSVLVKDRGRGLGGRPADDLTRRFARGDNVGDVVGSGLGLTIVEEVAEIHGGSFRLREREGGGTCAELLLPLR